MAAVLPSIDTQPFPQQHPDDHPIMEKPALNTPVSNTPSLASSSSTPPVSQKPQHRKSVSMSVAGPAHPPAISVQRSSSLRERTPVALDGTQKDANANEVEVRLPPSPPLTSVGADVEGDRDTSASIPRMSVDSHRSVRFQDDVDSEQGSDHGDMDEVDMIEVNIEAEERPLSFQSDITHPKVELDVPTPIPSPKLRPPSFEAEPDTGAAQSSATARSFEIIRHSIPPEPLSPLKPPKSSYYVGPPSGATYFYTPPSGTFGVHHPRDIVRIERDYTSGELVQFASVYPIEFQGRITPTQFLETVNELNEGLIRAHALWPGCWDNLLAVLTLWLSTLVLDTHYEREMRRVHERLERWNRDVYNPSGLNILWPRKQAFLFLEIEYY